MIIVLSTSLKSVPLSTELRSFHQSNSTKQSTATMAAKFLRKVLEELGLVSLYNSTFDTKLLCIQRFVRLFAYGGSTLILVAYLTAVGTSETKSGLFMTLTLVGDTIISFFLTLFADALGRKATLALGAALMACSGVIFALFGNYWVLLAAAIFGVISPRCVQSSRCLVWE